MLDARMATLVPVAEGDPVTGRSPDLRAWSRSDEQPRRARAAWFRLLATVHWWKPQRPRRSVRRQPQVGDPHLPQAAPSRPHLSQLRHSRSATRSQDSRSVVRPVNGYAEGTFCDAEGFVDAVDRVVARLLVVRSPVAAVLRARTDVLRSAVAVTCRRRPRRVSPEPAPVPAARPTRTTRRR